MGLQISQFGNSQFFTSDGSPAAGYQLFVYQGRSSVKAVVYTDRDGGGEHTNPILLDANGYTPQPIYIDTAKVYRFVLALDIDEDPPTIPLYVVDQVSAGLETQTVSTAEWIPGPTPTYVSSTSFTLTGDQRGTFHVGRRLKLTTGAGALYAVITNSAFGAVTTVSIALDAGTLDASLSAVQYSFLSAANSAWPSGRSSGLTTVFSGPVTVPVGSSFNLLTAGTIFPFAGTSYPPAGYLQCNGQAVSRTLYPSLFSAIGTVFGAGDGSGTFNVPTIGVLVTNVRYMIRYA